MKRNQLLLWVALSAAALLVIALAFRNRRPPGLPHDATHRTFVEAGACLACHGPAGSHPRSPNHPPGQECHRCHLSQR